MSFVSDGEDDFLVAVENVHFRNIQDDRDVFGSLSLFLWLFCISWFGFSDILIELIDMD